MKTFSPLFTKINKSNYLSSLEVQNIFLVFFPLKYLVYNLSINKASGTQLQSPLNHPLLEYSTKTPGAGTSYRD